MNVGQPRCYSGFSLGEMLAALVIGALVLTAILGVYGRANQAAEAVLAKIEAPATATEVLQLIARDLDRIMETADLEVQVRNGLDNGYPSAELVLRRTYKDAKNEKKVLEEITWRSAHDNDSAAGGLALYRSYQGVGLEDKLLDSKREDWESNYPYVPVCGGVTLFTIDIPKGEGFVRVWPSGSPPTAIKITISFAEPYETADGSLDVSEDKKIARTMTIDRTRTIKFTLAGGEGQEGQEGPEDRSEENLDEKEQAGQETPKGVGTQDTDTEQSSRSRSERVSRPTRRL